MKGIFSDVGTVSEVTIYEVILTTFTCPCGKVKDLLKGKCRYCWEYGRPSYFICERPNVVIKN